MTLYPFRFLRPLFERQATGDHLFVPPTGNRPIRPFATSSSSPPSSSESTRKKRFLISSCNDVFRNLAFEDWLYNNENFAHQDILLLWRNSPCVVIGRHQNPWSEVNLLDAAERGVAVARRRSGGGTVYHDLENLNVTFFTTRKGYDRKRNLSFLVGALKAQWPHLDVAVNSRDDLVAQNGEFKVSGSSAKLGGDTSYHHCTLLIDAQLHALKALLKTPLTITENKATASVPSPVINLRAIDPSLHRDLVIDSIIDHWKNSISHDSSDSLIGLPSAQLVDPWQETQYPGISELETELRSWSWVYGRTPKFTVEKEVQFDAIQIPRVVTIAVSVTKGKISGVTLGPSTVSKDMKENTDQKLNLRDGFEDLLSTLETRLNQTLNGVEFRAQVVSVYLANLTKDISCQSQSDEAFRKLDLTNEKMTIALTLFDHLADLCLQ